MKIVQLIAVVGLIMPLVLLCNEEKTVRINESFTIDLTESAGTGYGWFFRGIEPCCVFVPIVELMSEEITQSANLPGGSQLRTFNFKAVKEGEQTLLFEFKRPWETVPAARQERFYVKVIQ